MEIVYRMNLENVDWATLKADLIRDHFDNGRSLEQYKESFNNSFVVCMAWDGEHVVGNARALSDGVCNAYVIDVWTHSQYRHRGIATQMMNYLLEHLSGQHVYLFTEDAREFYHKLGFKEQGTGMGLVVGRWLGN
jgi:predicted GNAT family acetyltransferase